MYCGSGTLYVKWCCSNARCRNNASCYSNSLHKMTSWLALGTGTRVRTHYMGTKSGPRFPGIFITRLLSTQHCHYGCEFVVIHNVYHKLNLNVIYVQTTSMTPWHITK